MRITHPAALAVVLCSQPGFTGDSAQIAAETNPVSALPARVRSVNLTAEITNQHEIYLPVQINGSEPMWFLLDSAAGFPWILDAKRASSLSGWQRVVTATGVSEPTFDVGMVTGATVNVGQLELTNQSIGITPLEQLQHYASRRLDGIVGYELFTQFVVEIDYLTGGITLHDPKTFTYSGSGFIVPANFEGKHWYMRARVVLDSGEHFFGRFLVDTGATQIAAAFTRPFVDAHQLIQGLQGYARHRTHVGLGGIGQSYVRNAVMLQIGHALLNNIAVDLSRDSTGVLASANYDGVIGGSLLTGFKVIFDPARQQIVLEANRGAAL